MSTNNSNQADPVTNIALPGNYWVRGLTGTTRWEPGTDRNISWSFATTTAHGTYASTNSTLLTSGTATGTYNPLDDLGNDGELKAAVRAAFNSIEAVANINLNEFVNPASFDTVDIKIMGFDNLNALGWGTFPGTDAMPGGGGEFEGFTLLATTGSGMTTDPLLGAGSNRQSTSLHEILHTLAMAHPHDTGHGSTAWSTSNNTGAGEDNLDNRRYSVMSYERGGLNTNSQSLNYGSDVTPMALDIAALHYLYGSRANHTGNTVYNLTDPETVALDVAGNDGSVSIGRAFYGIWDTGGTDSINYGGANHALINLNRATLTSSDPAHITAWMGDVTGTSLYGGLSQELKDDISDASFHAGGFFSRVFYNSGAAALGGYSIANGLYADAAHNAAAIIENASGGNQSDLIIGNEHANALYGNGGNDVIHGSAGGDTIYGGTGTDQMFGGTGNDTFVIQNGWDGGAGEAINGGADSDSLDLTSLSSAVIVDLSAGTFKGGGGANSISLVSVENVFGTNQADSLVGSNDANTLKGAGGADTINGGSGDDLLYGGDGDDTINDGAGGDGTNGEGGNDRIVMGDASINGDTYYGGTGTDTFDASAFTWATAVSIDLTAKTWSYSAGSEVVDEFENIEGANAQPGIVETLRGNELTNVINGNGGDDVIFGMNGDDVLGGGTGADQINGGSGVDTASYAASAAGVVVDLFAGTASGGDAQGDTLASIENVTGSGADDTLTGNGGSNVLTGGLGADTLVYADNFTGSTNVDTFNGDAGTDTFVLSNEALDRRYVDLSVGQFQLNAGGDIRGYLNSIENVTVASNHVVTGDDLANVITGTSANGANEFHGNGGSDQLNGGGGNDILSGGDGDDHLEGGQGGDTIAGGAGTDTARYTGSSVGVTISLLSGATAGGDAAGDIFSSIENLTGSNFADFLKGDGAANRLEGGGAADRLDGHNGNDVLAGGAGGDILNGDAGSDSADYSTSSAGVTISLLSGGAVGGDAAGDTFTSIENLIGSAFADFLKGDAIANRLAGGDGADRLDGHNADDILAGGAGGDILNGDAGSDSADYSTSSAGVTISLLSGSAVGGDAAGDTFTSIENLIGSAFADFLKGDAIANRLAGGAGADRLDGHNGDDILAGGAGGDILNGDAGSDRADYSNSSAGVTVSLATGNASGGDATGDTFSSIEGLIGSGYADFLKGTAGTNTLDGGAGDDLLEGGAGADALIGGAGVDTARYASSGAAVTISLLTGSAAGGDATGDTFAGIENLEGSIHADFLKGDASANALWGQAGADRLDGHSGDDILAGGAGADILNGDAGTDTASYAGSAAAVTVSLLTGVAAGGDAAGDTFSSVENLTGSGFADHLKGSAGSNILNGGAGGDILNGEAGQDTASYAGSSAGVTVSLLTGNATGGDATGDTLISIEHLIGSSHADYLKGSNAANILEGGGGADTLEGLGGNDRFVFGNGVGDDTIVGFIAGAGTDDRLDFVGNGFLNSFADFLAHSSQVGADTVIDVGGGDELTLLAVNRLTFHQDDFVF